MLGLGAAFDFHAGTVSRAPLWIAPNTGWNGCTRLGSDPGRLWWRYMSTNSMFVLRTLRDPAAPGRRPPAAPALNA